MIIRSIISATAVLFASAPAFAGGLPGNYVATGAAIGLQGQGAGASILGRAELTPGLSARAQVTQNQSTEGSVGLTGDIAVDQNLNIYLGGGAGFSGGTGSDTVLNRGQSTVGYAQLGIEGAIGDAVLFLDNKVAFGNQTTYVPTVGVGIKF